MKISTGMVRRIDDLGRIVIPKELRRTLNIADGEAMAISVDGNRIIFEKYLPGCVVCGNMEELHDVKGTVLCKDCIKEFSGKLSKK